MGMTYSEAIQSLIDQTESLYQKVGSLRDFAIDSAEKKHWNKLRTDFRSASASLRALDNDLPKDRSKEIVIGNY